MIVGLAKRQGRYEWKAGGGGSQRLTMRVYAGQEKSMNEATRALIDI